MYRRSYEVDRRRSNLTRILGLFARRLLSPVGLGLVGMLVLSLSGPALVPLVARLIPTRYIIAYAPQPIQDLALNIDPNRYLPTPVAASPGAQTVLEGIAPTLMAGEVAQAGQPPAGSVASPQDGNPSSFSGPEPASEPLPADLLLDGFVYSQQTWSNCGPATISMALSYYGATFTQEDAAQFLKPNIEDRNVNPDELVAYVRSVGFDATYRVNGDLQRLKRLIAAGYPVIIEKGLDGEEDGDWLGHYVLLIGYSDDTGQFMSHDSFQGPNRAVSYTELDAYWRQFNRTYVVVYPPDGAALIATLIGEDMDDVTMYTKATNTALEETQRINDGYAWFNLGSSLVGLGRYEEAAAAYDRALQARLPFRMLWYQFGLYEAYFHSGRFPDLLLVAEATIEDNPRPEESYYYRGLVYLERGQTAAAQQEFEAALRINPRNALAQEALTQASAQLR